MQVGVYSSILSGVVSQNGTMYSSRKQGAGALWRSWLQRGQWSWQEVAGVVALPSRLRIIVNQGPFVCSSLRPPPSHLAFTYFTIIFLLEFGDDVFAFSEPSFRHFHPLVPLLSLPKSLFCLLPVLEQPSCTTVTNPSSRNGNSLYETMGY